MKTCFLFISLFIGLNAYCQTVTYDDVAVIVNDNSQTSIAIGDYFQSARSIPNQNIIHVFAPTTEEIDSLQFEQIRAQIESHLITNNLVDSINYLVTTKGLPLKVESGCFDSLGLTNDLACASFDSELTFILGTYSDKIGLSGAWPNPVFQTTANFSRDSTGVYLVTRLDGYTEQNVFSMIDRSGPGTGLNQQSSQVILDLNTANPGDSAYFMNHLLQPTYDYLMSNSWNGELDMDNGILLNQSNVFAYVYGGNTPISNVSLNFNWTEGSISSMSNCKTAITFDDSLNASDYFLIADLISEGCTGAHGHIDNIYFSQMLNAEILLNRYLDTLENYNLAESFYMAEPTLSWQGVIVGDPKSSVVIDNLAGTSKPTITEVSIYPNPSTGIIHLNGTDLITTVKVIDMKGAEIMNYDQLEINAYDLDLSEVQNGVYLIQVEIGEKLLRKRVVISH